MSKDGVMGLLLSAADREAFIAAYKVELMEQNGRVIKEYVKIPNELLENTDTNFV